MAGLPRTVLRFPSMRPIPIEDFDDPRIADYRNLRDATLARDRGRFIVEGRGNLEVLLARSLHTPESILLSERAHASIESSSTPPSALSKQLHERTPSCPVYLASQPLLDRIVGFPIHRGCLAVCARPVERDPIELAREALEAELAPRIVVLEGITNHDNVGGIFRAAMALGGRAVLLCPRTCDPLYRKAIRTSMGGSLCVPFGRAEAWPALLGSLGELGYEILALDPGTGSSPIEALDRAELGPAALLFGTEGPGLSEAALACADRRLRIEMEPGVDSLNVAMAAGVTLHALRSVGKPRVGRTGR